MLVVLDTNQLFDDPFLTRPTLLALLSQAACSGIAFAVPSVVVDEGVNQYAKHLVKRPSRGRDELGVRDDEADFPDGDPDWLERYRTRLLERLTTLGIGLLAEPAVSDVERWRAAARKPFKAGELHNDGDARIWATILDAAEGGDIVFVSDNHKDFAANRKAKTQLHPDLCSDLVALGFASDRVQLAPSSAHVLRLVGAPDVPTAEAADLLERGKGNSRLRDKAAQAFQSSIIDDDEADQLGLDVYLDPESVYVDSFDTSSLEVLSAFALNDTEIAVEVAVDGEALVDVLLLRADAFTLPDDSPIRVHDYDHNASYAEGQAYLQVRVVLETVVDRSRGVEDPTVVSVELDPKPAAGS